MREGIDEKEGNHAEEQSDPDDAPDVANVLERGAIAATREATVVVELAHAIRWNEAEEYDGKGSTEESAGEATQHEGEALESFVNCKTCVAEALYEAVREAPCRGDELEDPCHKEPVTHTRAVFGYEPVRGRRVSVHRGPYDEEGAEDYGAQACRDGGE